MSYVLSHHNSIIIFWAIFIFFLEIILNKQFHIKIFSSYMDRWVKNGVFGLVNRILNPMVSLPIVLFATNIHFWQRPIWINEYFYLIIDIILLDFFSYCFHIFSHYIPFLWRFHEVHHLDSKFDSTTGLRIHFGEIIINNIFRIIPIVLFSIPLKSILFFELILFVEGLFHHSNLNLPKKIEQLLAKVIVTPLRHSVHHHSLYTHWNTNFGFILIWWDKLFGTYCSDERQPNWHIGLGYSPDLNCKELFFSPFKLRKLRHRMKAQGYKVVKHTI